MAFVTDDCSEGARKDDYIEQRLERIGVQFGKRLGKLLYILRNTLVGMRQPGEHTGGVVRAICEVEAMQMASQNGAESKRNCDLHSLEGGVNNGGWYGVESEGKQHTTESRPVCGGDILSAHTLQSGDAVAQQGAGGEQHGLQGDQGGRAGKRAGDAYAQNCE